MRKKKPLGGEERPGGRKNDPKNISRGGELLKEGKKSFRNRGLQRRRGYGFAGLLGEKATFLKISLISP